MSAEPSWVEAERASGLRLDRRFNYVVVDGEVVALFRYANGGPKPEDDKPPIDWVITGGESGPGARPMHPNWARSLRDQCVAVGVSFFHKQNGEWAEAGDDWTHAVFPDGKAYTKAWICEETDPGEQIEGAIADGDGVRIRRVGKAAAGREIDGRTWDEFPP